MTDNTKDKEPRFKVGDVIYIAGEKKLFKGKVKRVYKDTYQHDPFNTQSKSIEWFYESTLNPFLNDVCDMQAVLTQKEYDEKKKVSRDFGHPYYWIFGRLLRLTQ